MSAKPRTFLRTCGRFIAGRWLAFTQCKNKKRKPISLMVPLLQELEEIIAATPCGDLTWLVTQFGQPFTSPGFGNWFRVRCDQAEFPHCTAHGLRKAGATIAAERGASERQLMAIFGWQTSKQAVLYTRAAEQKVLAGGAMALLSTEQK
jgi:integrase